MIERVLLYVEDEDAAFFLFETALQEARIKVRLYRASDGEQAIEFLRRTGSYEQAPSPDLVLLDINLPRKNGLEVLSEIQSTDSLRQIPAVVFTSSSLPSDRKKSLALGAQEYITKPSTFDGFIEAVKLACSHLPSNSEGAHDRRPRPDGQGRPDPKTVGGR
jgi:two-component system, chemotaxis family, response regulator Rcp1